jgi:hypothetical protein
MSEYGVALFYTTSAVMRAEKLLVKAGYRIKLVPTPRQFSSDCGIALRFEWTERDRIVADFETAGIEFDSVRHL